MEERLGGGGRTLPFRSRRPLGRFLMIKCLCVLVDRGLSHGRDTSEQAS